jgi:hypothetical protein
LLLLLWLVGDGHWVRREGCRRKTAPSAWPSFTHQGAIMKCDICGHAVENSDELQKHVEREHATGADNLETPDLLGDTPEESAAVEIPLPTH